MNYLPVLSYPGGKRVIPCINAFRKLLTLVTIVETGMTTPPDSTDLEAKAHETKAPAQLAGSALRSAKPPSGLPKAPSQLKPQSKPAKPIHPAEARSKAVYLAMECLLEQGALSDADLLQAVTNLSGDEFLQANAAGLFSIVHETVSVKLSVLVASQQQVLAYQV